MVREFQLQTIVPPVILGLRITGGSSFIRYREDFFSEIEGSMRERVKYKSAYILIIVFLVCFIKSNSYAEVLVYADAVNDSVKILQFSK